MRRIITAITAAMLAAMPLLAQETSSYSALWTDLSVAHPLPYGLTVDAGLGFRTLDALENANRFDANIGLDYKIGKHFKVGVSYTFIYRHYLSETEYKYQGNHDYSSYQGLTVTETDADGETQTYRYKGYNVDAAHWAPRHRFALDLTADKRFRKTLRVSLRERYQYTHQAARDIDRTRYRVDSYDADGNVSAWEDPEVVTKHKNAWDRHLLRSRLKLSIDRKGWQWEPYVSGELHNNMGDSWHLDKVRLAAGADYSITKQHKLSIAYVFTHENDDDGNENIHALSIGYRFKF